MTENWEKEWKVDEEGTGWKLYRSKVRCPQTLPPVPQSQKIEESGGAYPYVYVYDPKLYETVWFTAGQITRGEYEEFLETSEVVCDVPASPHGCWKLKKHQRLVLTKKTD